MFNITPSTKCEYYITEVENDITLILRNNNKTLVLQSGSQSVTLVALPYNFVFCTKDNKIYIVTEMHMGRNTRRVFVNKIVGTYTKLVTNALIGLKKPYEIKLEILGVGYKFKQIDEQTIQIFIGYSCPIVVHFLPNIKVVVANDHVHCSIFSIDKQLVGQAASKLLLIKKFNRYNMSGIKHKYHVIKKKIINKKN